MNTNKKPITSIIVGAGHRSILYSRWALKNPDELKITGVVDPNPLRREKAAKIFDIPEDMCFETIEDLVKRGKIADTVINGTMDHLHVQTSIPLLRAGYDMLLEKPISTNKEDLLELLKVARETKSKVMVCHVLRYAPFYVEIKKRILNGEIGEIFNIQTNEHVSYHHISVAYVRGKWNNLEACKSTMLMAKCCHDLDIITWMAGGVPPKKVSSFGSLSYFNREHAPENSGTRCLVDCPIEESCDYSARKLYINHPNRWSPYVWSFIENIPDPAIEDKINSLKTDNPHGRCMWKCENNVVDRQSVTIEFNNGVTATHNMVGGVSKPARNIHIIGSKGEISGCMEDGEFTIMHMDSREGHEYTKENITIDVNNDMHGGGDHRLVEDFVKVLNGSTPSISTTSLEDSIYGHLIGFNADLAREESRVVEIAPIK